jgi:hypothetical protein
MTTPHLQTTGKLNDNRPPKGDMPALIVRHAAKNGGAK